MSRAAFAVFWAIRGVQGFVAPQCRNRRAYALNYDQPTRRSHGLCAEKTTQRELYVKTAEEEMDEVRGLER